MDSTDREHDVREPIPGLDGFLGDGHQRCVERRLVQFVDVVSLQAVARLRGLPDAQIAAELEQAGIVPAEVEPVPVPTAVECRPDTDFSELDAMEGSSGSAGDKSAPKAGRGAHGE